LAKYRTIGASFRALKQDWQGELGMLAQKQKRHPKVPFLFVAKYR